ncbi:MAG: hypothetical protein BWX63_02305 [Bacteroidetes bacterium ADurb.Bin041]|nr:MAG: hypothetical protein BWX63_02305 [Bacteroidetes bacterium ADurb.Bin041]
MIFSNLQIKMKKTTVNSKKTVAMRIGGQNSDLAIKDFDKSNRVCGLTNGAFSLISLIDSVLKKTGKANVIISTWSAGLYDVGVMNELILSGRVDDFKIILDRSFKTRQKNYAVTIEDLFSPENIRTTNTHSKFVLIWNDDWNVCIRSSMNLNENKRCENFDIDNDIDIFNLFKSFSDELFDKQQAGVIESRGIVDKTFDTLFDDSDFSTKKESFDFKFDFRFD